MNTSSPGIQSLVKRLLEHETGAHPEADELAAGANAVFRKFANHLEPLVGATGFQTLLARALHLTRSDFPILEGVKSGKTISGAFLEGLGEAVRNQDAGEVREAVTLMLATFLGLVAHFIGDDLATRIVSRAWPDLPPGTADSAFEGKAV